MRRLVVSLCVVFLVSTAGCKSKTATVAPANKGEDWVPLSFIPVGEPKFASRLLRGFHNGAAGWKWTGQSFAISIDPPEPPAATRVTMDFSVPDELFQVTGQVTLSAKVNGVDIGSETYTKAGRFYYIHNIPKGALDKKPAELEFTLDKVAPGPEHPFGLIVVTVGLDFVEPAAITQDRAAKMARAGYKEVLESRGLKMSAEKQTEFMKLFHEIPVWKNTWFQNVEIEKNPLDLWMMQQIFFEVQPDFMIETGAWHGGSALYWAHTLNGLGLEHSRVITVDIVDQTQTAKAHPLWKKYVTFMQGSSTDPKIVEHIAKLVAGKKVVITLDSDHSAKHVLNELHAYAPLVSKGSYLIVEDTHMDGVPTYPEFGPGPMTAVREFLAEPAGKEFEQDFKREAMIMTFNPGGWLRKK